MDFSKFKTSDWLKVGGGGVMLIAYFLKWWKLDVEFFGSIGLKGSDYFFTGTLPWLLLLAVAVLTVLSVLGIFKLPSSIPAPLVFLAAAALSLLLILIRFFSDGIDDSGDGLSRGIGLYLALLASIAVVVGTVLGFKESGGDLNDLKDMNKLKGQFNTGAGSSMGSVPPPPPGSMTPPPPPPPGTPPPPPPPGG